MAVNGARFKRLTGIEAIRDEDDCRVQKEGA